MVPKLNLLELPFEILELCFSYVDDKKSLSKLSMTHSSLRVLAVPRLYRALDLSTNLNFRGKNLEKLLETFSMSFGESQIGNLVEKVSGVRRRTFSSD